jgi:hypothetical protein
MNPSVYGTGRAPRKAGPTSLNGEVGRKRRMVLIGPEPVGPTGELKFC